jgi:hypothetical protein
MSKIRINSHIQPYEIISLHSDKDSLLTDEEDIEYISEENKSVESYNNKDNVILSKEENLNITKEEKEEEKNLCPDAPLMIKNTEPLKIFISESIKEILNYTETEVKQLKESIIILKNKEIDLKNDINNFQNQLIQLDKTVKHDLCPIDLHTKNVKKVDDFEKTLNEFKKDIDFLITQNKNIVKDSINSISFTTSLLDKDSDITDETIKFSESNYKLLENLINHAIKKKAIEISVNTEEYKSLFIKFNNLEENYNRLNDIYHANKKWYEHVEHLCSDFTKQKHAIETFAQNLFSNSSLTIFHRIEKLEFLISEMQKFQKLNSLNIKSIKMNQLEQNIVQCFNVDKYVNNVEEKLEKKYAFFHQQEMRKIRITSLIYFLFLSIFYFLYYYWK